MNRRALCLVFLCAWPAACPTLAQLPAPPQGSAAAQGLTAEEIMVKARGLYGEGKYAEAAALYNQFITDFGEAKEAQEAIRQMRYPLAICLVHLQKFPEALEAIQLALEAEPPLQQSQVQELMFWQGVCEMQDQEYERARASFGKFIALFPPGSERNPNYLKQFPAIYKVPEAQLLIGSTYLLEEKFKDAAAFFAKSKAGMNAVNRGRATVLELYALMQADEDGKALGLVTEEFPRIGDLLQLVTFQTMTLELGSRFLEKKEFRKAIVCLQRIWSSDRLLHHQETRLKDMESRLEAAEANPESDPYTKFLLAQMIGKVQKEISGFRKIQNFDSALRLRLATAYQGMLRYREAALIMEAMLADMPPDKIVESASGNLVQCWGAIERWLKVIEAAKAFAAKFPNSPNLPLILYMQGIAEEKDYQYDQAVATFDALAKKYPKSDYAPRAQFMKGFSLLQAEKNKEAIAAFEEFSRKYPRHEMAEAAAYWRGMGFSLDKQYARSREVLDDYLAAYKNGAFRSKALFRKAYNAQQAKDFATSIKELKKYTQEYPAEEETSEARILLADAYMNQGMMEEGIASLKGIPQDDRSYAEAVFKTGKAYKLMEEYGRLREIMEQFQAKDPRNPRVAEAIYWIGWTYRQEEQLEKARDVYWAAISEYGDEASVRSVEDLFPALAKLYKGEDEQTQYFARLRDLREESRMAGKKTLAMRAVWAQAAALKRKDPNTARLYLLEASADVNVQTANPLLLADFADALLASGKEDQAAQMYRDLVKWNPRAPQKDQALAALGAMELRRGNEKAALAHFDRFERETLGSRLFGQVMLAKAELQEKRGQPAAAKETLEKLLANQYSSGQEKAKALFLIGEMHMKEGKPQLAIPYYQRIYVMYGRWRDWVAKAYFRSGEAFEQLKDELSARRTYQEMTSSEDLSGFQETARARERLKALGGPLEEPQPTPAQG